MRFKDKTVIVTGGLGGIGKACVERFLSEGANVLAADLTTEQAQAVYAQCAETAEKRLLVSACNVSIEGDVVSTYDLAEHRFGSVDVIVNVAGMMIYKPFEDLRLADWHQVMSVNVFGAAMFTAQAFRRMTSGGAIVNVSSIHAFQTSPLVGPYAAAKAALNSLTRTASIEGKAKGIRANAVLPGAVDTPMLWASPNLKSGAEKLEPGDVGSPANIAAAVAFLAGDDATFITGSALTVDGGRLAKL